MKYILSEQSSNGCIFCTKPQEANDARNYIVLRDRTCYTLLNLYPYNNGHMMVVPYKHCSDLDDLTEAELGDLLVLVRRSQQLLKATMKPQGFNIGLNLGKSAGAGIADHLHIHIVPRWSGDSNFMTAVNDMRIIPESLDATYAKLQEALASQ